MAPGWMGNPGAAAATSTSVTGQDNGPSGDNRGVTPSKEGTEGEAPGPSGAPVINSFNEVLHALIKPLYGEVEIVS